jgi:tRNA-dihydrouridine synthase
VALEIIDRVREAVPDRIPVTLKMRRGIDDSKQSRDNFFEIFDGAYNRGVAAITVHGRTVLQRYKGPSDWQALREIKQHAGQRIVLGSGDLFTAQDCRNMMVETGVDGVTVARGAIGNPWIFRDARALMDGKPIPTAPSLAEQRDVIGEHFRLSQEIYGPDRCVTQMRKFGIRYSQMHPQPDSVRDAFVNAKQPEQWWGVLRKWYDEFEDPSSLV